MTKSFNPYKNRIITGEKIILREITKNDLVRCVEWLGDPEVNKYLSHNIKNATEEQEIEWFKFIRHSKTDVVFTINTLDKNIHIGNCGLHKINMAEKSCDFGIFIGDKNYWNKGYGTDATKTILNFAGGILKLSTIRLLVYEYNNRAISVYKKCGFVQINILKKHHFYDNIYWDAFVMEYNCPGKFSAEKL